MVSVSGTPFTNYTQTGIPGVSGGYAYPPGSPMSQFMDGVNNTAIQATRGPSGENVVSWATNLAQQAQARKQATGTSLVSGTGGSAAAGSSGGALMQVLQTLMTMLASLQQKKSV